MARGGCAAVRRRIADPGSAEKIFKNYAKTVDNFFVLWYTYNRKTERYKIMKIKDFTVDLNEMDKMTVRNTKCILTEMLKDNDTETINDYLITHGSNFTIEDIKTTVQILQFLIDDDINIDATWMGR